MALATSTLRSKSPPTHWSFGQLKRKIDFAFSKFHAVFDLAVLPRTFRPEVGQLHSQGAQLLEL